MKQLQCATFEGIDAKTVEVQFSATKGLPAFTIVGMANTAITESKERVKSALLSNGFTFPPKRLTVNLAPSDLRKEGSHFDLPIAALIALGNYEGDIGDWYVFGNWDWMEMLPKTPSSTRSFSLWRIKEQSHVLLSQA